MSYLTDYLGDNKYWKNDATKIIDKFENNAFVLDGVVRWKTNNRVPPQDILEIWNHVGKGFDLKKSMDVKERESDEFLKEYRERQKNYVASPEELEEMKMCFG
jgi:hypothetical protein